MEFTRCLRCMEKVQGYPCPRCGYNPATSKAVDYGMRPGTILNGKYVAGAILGQGGFGITYVGWNLALDCKVAIKEYFPSGHVGRSPASGNLHWYNTPQAEYARNFGMEMFLKEARKMSRVGNVPQVVHVHDLFQENGTAYIVMDFVEGETLMVRLKRNGALSWSEARDIFLPTIRAMARVHEAGLIHRDLSPDNLMLLPDGSVKILDLGAAKDLNINSGVSSMQVAKGGFSPLEQYTQRGSSGPWSDVYSMAATMYYALTGVLPPAAVDRVSNDPIRWDLPQLTALPTHVRMALKKAMALYYEQRTQSMAEFARQLNGSNPPPPPPYLLYIILALVGAIALALGILLLRDSGQEPRISEPSTPPQTISQPTLPPQTTPAPVSIPTQAPTETFTEATLPAESSRLSIMPHPISGGRRHTVAIRQDGTVLSIGQQLDGQKDVASWENMVSVSASVVHTAGLKADGTAVALGANSYGQCDVEDWNDLVSISAGFYHTVGLRSDGTVVATGSNEYHQCNVENWSDIIAVSAGWYHTVGLKADGTVLSTGWDVPTLHDVTEWTDIVAISAGGYHTAALKANGTVVATGRNTDKQCNVSNWKNIVAIDTGMAFTAGLRADGTAVAVGGNGSGQCNLGGWKGIIAISTGSFHTLGLKADGTLVATGDNDYHQCDVRSWSDLMLPADGGNT